MIRAIKCWLLHQPQFGWCKWDVKGNTHAQCKCAVCGHEYLVKASGK